MFSDILFPKISKIPEIGVLEDNTNLNEQEKIFRPYLQIFKNSEIVYNSLIPNAEGGEDVKVLRKTDISCWFNVNIDVKIIFIIKIIPIFFEFLKILIFIKKIFFC
jgi:hypothetical protein